MRFLIRPCLLVSRIEPSQRAETSIEVILFGTHSLKHAEVKITERLASLSINVPAVLPAATSENQWQVCVRMPAATTKP
jgi:hypothetical protein